MVEHRKDANAIASEYQRRAQGGLLPAYRPRTGTFSVWLTPDTARNPDFVSTGSTVQVTEGPAAIVTNEDGSIEVFPMHAFSYACFVYDDDEGE